MRFIVCIISTTITPSIIGQQRFYQSLMSLSSPASNDKLATFQRCYVITAQHCKKNKLNLLIVLYFSKDNVTKLISNLFKAVAMVEAMKKWDAQIRRGLEPPWGSRSVTAGKFFDNIGANLCNFVHFVVKF